MKTILNVICNKISIIIVMRTYLAHCMIVYPELKVGHEGKVVKGINKTKREEQILF